MEAQPPPAPPRLVSLTAAARALNLDARTLRVRLERRGVQPDAVDALSRPMFDLLKLRALPASTPPAPKH